jgi:hypothetical protein
MMRTGCTSRSRKVRSRRRSRPTSSTASSRSNARAPPGAPTGLPHSPQNFVLEAAPQAGQIDMDAERSALTT